MTFRKQTKLPLTKLIIDEIPVWCDSSTTTNRPYIPESMRYQIFQQLHNLSHPGPMADQRLVSSCVV